MVSFNGNGKEARIVNKKAAFFVSKFFARNFNH